MLAMRHVAETDCMNVSVMVGSAERVFLPDDSVDVVHARFAYFWGPGCEAGLGELERILRPGGTAFIIDNDDERGKFATWTSRSERYPQTNFATKLRFWQDQGFAQERLIVDLRFTDEAEFKRVIRNEFAPRLALDILAECARGDLVFSYGLCLYHRAY